MARLRYQSKPGWKLGTDHEKDPTQPPGFRALTLFSFRKFMWFKGGADGPQKFPDRVVRPVFRTAYFEVEGAHENEAANLPSGLAAELPEDQWPGRFDPESYHQHVHIVRPSQTVEGHQFSLRDFPQ